MIHLKEQYWAIEIPQDAWILKHENFKTDFVINMGYLIYPIVGKKKWLSLDGAPGLKFPGLDYNERGKGAIKLPPGDWQLISTSKGMTDELAIDVVDSSQWFFPVKHTRYVDYALSYDREYKQRWSEGFGTALESFRSLLTSKECHQEKNYVILKKG